MSTAIALNPTPGKPKSIEYSATEIFHLRYKKAGLCQELYFKAPDTKAAIEKGKEFCEKKGLRFLYVNPLVVDLDKFEFREDS